MAKRKTNKVSAALLVELLTEELPPRCVRVFGEVFAERILNGLVQRHLKLRVPKKNAFATARRLAVLIPDVDSRAADRSTSTRLMPSKVAFDSNGNATTALQKRLEKEGLSLDAALQKLERKFDDGTEYIYINLTIPGLVLDNVLSSVIEEAIAKLPTLKVMRWGAGEAKFVRPVHGLVMMHGSRVVNGKVLGLKSGRRTFGHRFLSTKPIVLRNAGDYKKALQNLGKVIPHFDERRKEIERQIKRLERKLGVSAISSSELADFSGNALLGDVGLCNNALRIAKEELLPEVTALVEFPVTYVGQFDTRFLGLPMECLTLSMRQHQRYFPCFDLNARLASTFLVVSNLETADPRQIVRGNERVLRARLSDAKFFFDQDRKAKLSERVPQLAHVIYHNKLGRQLEHVERIKALATSISKELGYEVSHTERAAYLCKADLLTEMVGEFPELQGIMGRYYALHDGEATPVADAIEQHYRPRFAGDVLPSVPPAISISLAEKILSTTALFRIDERPTGERDPFGLRRQALGVLRILIERQLPLDLQKLIVTASKYLADKSFSESTVTEMQRQAEKQRKSEGRLTAFGVATQTLPVSESHISDIFLFFLDRLRGYLREKGYSAGEIEAVLSPSPTRIDHVVRRADAVRAFAALPEAEALASANKRISNILKKAEQGTDLLRAELLIESEEKDLFNALENLEPTIEDHNGRGEYTEALLKLAQIRQTVDRFFDRVLVNTEEKSLRDNRLFLLLRLNDVMNRVADISKLVA